MNLRSDTSRLEDFDIALFIPLGQVFIQIRTGSKTSDEDDTLDRHAILLGLCDLTVNELFNILEDGSEGLFDVRTVINY